jgi:hypothetical protein
MSRSLRVKLDVGGWTQKERTATTVQISVREEDGGVPFQGIGVAVMAPEDYPEVVSKDQVRVGILLAAERAIRDARLPAEYQEAVVKLIAHEVMSTEIVARSIGESYLRVTRRVPLRPRRFADVVRAPSESFEAWYRRGICSVTGKPRVECGHAL